MQKRKYGKRWNIYKVHFILKDGRTFDLMDRSQTKPTIESLAEKLKAYMPSIRPDQVKGISYQVLSPTRFKKLFNQFQNAQ